ncbi:MAG: hypothetical protein JEZ09_11980 [Salinivirgaceae bacterium]|nr:hypothetical protein [Salinivirgaceae bacterium]
MKKILIFSYFFTPCNLTASQRALGWVKYLHKFGYYPTMITRNWDVEIKEQKDISKMSGQSIIHEKYDTHEVYYLPYKGNLRDKLFSKYGEKYSFVRKTLSLIELIGSNYSNIFIPFSQIYFFSKQLVAKNNFKALIITANPFILFRFGYLLNKKFNIPWIADYRDDWSTSELTDKNGALNKLLHILDCRSEKKWIKNAKFITSVSPSYTNKISNFTGVKGEILYNGFFEEEYKDIDPKPLFKEITLTYNGTLYATQNVEIFIEGFKKAIKYLKGSSKKLRLYFPGLDFKPDQGKRIRNLLKGYEDFYIITDRISRNEVLKIQQKSHALLMFPHNNIKGIPSSKLYEYLGLRKPILVSPSDHDILEKTLLETNSGKVCNASEEVFNFLLMLVSNYAKNIEEFSFENRLLYSRKEQTKKLAQLLDSID